MKPLALSLALAFACLLAPAPAQAQSYVASLDLERRGPYRVRSEDRQWFDARRQRPVPVRVFAPMAAVGAGPVGLRPLVVFSHGLGGSREGYGFIGEHLASHGYLVVHPTHVGSDAEVAARGALALIRAGADPQNAIDRPADVSFVIDRVFALRASDSLFRRVDVSKVAVAGHSFGAYTALAAVGQTIRQRLRTLSFTDPRVDCAIAMSSQGPGTIGLTPSSWDRVDVPVMTLTGTEDTGLGTPDVADRRVAFESMPPGLKFHMTIAGAEHLAFSDYQRPGTVRDPRHHSWILAATTGFFRAILDGDQGALSWLVRRQLQRDTLGEVKQEQR